EIAATLLPHVARVMGVGAAEMTDMDGRVVASYGAPIDQVGEARVTIPLEDGWLTVQANPYTPYFGREAQELMAALADFTDVALLTMSKLDANAVQPDVRAVTVDEVVRETLRDLGYERDVQADVPSDLHVAADREHLLRIIRNYVENAFKYGLPPVIVTAQDA